MGSDSDSDLAVQRPPKHAQRKPADGSDSDLAVQRPPKQKESKPSKPVDAGSDSDLAVARPSKQKKVKPVDAGSDSDLAAQRPSKHKKVKPVDAGSDSDLAVQRPSKHKKVKPVDAGSDSDLAITRPTKHKSKPADAGSDSDLAVDRPAKRRKSKIPDMAVQKHTKHKKSKQTDPGSDSDLAVDRPATHRKSKIPDMAVQKQTKDEKSKFTDPILDRDLAVDPKGKGKGKGKEDGNFFGQHNFEPKGKGKGKGKEDGNEQPKEQPNFEPSGLLALEDNAKNGIPLKFTVPAEVRLPRTKWRLYIFTKANEAPKIIPIHKEVGYLFGKDRRVAEVPTDHPTCSKQHAVLHYRQTKSGLVKPYIMDLESVNGTFVNGDRIEASRYYELKEKDVLKFGMSTREFVLLHGGSANHMSIDPKDLRSPSEG